MSVRVKKKCKLQIVDAINKQVQNLGSALIQDEKCNTEIRIFLGIANESFQMLSMALRNVGHFIRNT